MNFGYQVWDAARVLCCYLEQHEGVCKGRKVLELGAGCGLIGILAARLGAEVTLTDTATVLPILRLNAELNASPSDAPGGLHVQELEWGMDVRESFPRGQFDVIVGSDLTYSDNLHCLLLVTLLQLVSEDTEVVLAVPRRRPDDVQKWCVRFQQYFDVEVLATEEDVAGYSSLGVFIKSGRPISIFRLRYVGPPPFEEDLTAVLAGLNAEDADDLLARLGLRDSDLECIEGAGEVDGPAVEYAFHSTN